MCSALVDTSGFQSGCSGLHFSQLEMRVSGSSHPCQDGHFPSFQFSHFAGMLHIEFHCISLIYLYLNLYLDKLILFPSLLRDDSPRKKTSYLCFSPTLPLGHHLNIHPMKTPWEQTFETSFSSVNGISVAGF